MSLPPSLVGYAVVAGFLALLAALVLAARAGSATNRTLAALLALTAGDVLAFELMRRAATDAAAGAFARVGSWYQLPAPFLTLLLLHFMFPARNARSRRWRLVALTLAGAGTLALATLFVADASLVVNSVRDTGTGRYGRPGPAAFASGILVVLAQSIAVVVSARAAHSRAASVTERRHAALVGLAFTLLAGHAGAVRFADLTNVAFWKAWGLQDALTLASVAALVIALVALRWLADPFESRARVVFLGTGGAAIAAGFWDGLVRRWLIAEGVLSPAYRTSRLLWVVAFAVTLAIALVRFGLAGFGSRLRARLTTACHVALVMTTALLPAAVLLAFTGVTSAGVTTALVLGGAAVSLSPVPLRHLARSLAGALLITPADPRVDGERARVVATAVEERRREAGEARADDTPLAELGRELDLDEDALTRLVAAVRAEKGESLLGRYRVERELGRGAFGTALLATDVTTGGRVVLKRFHVRDRPTRALAEARALASVRHPRVIPFVDVQRVGDEVFLVMGYAPGGSARDRLQREGALAAADAGALARDLLDGLHALHEAGLVHRDVKPGNLLLDADGRGLIGDFGSARFMRAPDIELTLTGEESALGSYATLAPEVLLGHNGTPASDVYAAGAVLYRLLTGEHYVDVAGRTIFQARQVILHDAPRLPHARVPPALAPVIARALAKDPRERWESARAMREAVDAALAVSVNGSGTEGASARSRSRPRA